MRILWLLPVLPYPPDTGGKQDPYYMMREFHAQGHDITSGIIYHGDAPPAIPDEFSSLITSNFFLPGNPGKLPSRLFASLADNVPFKFRKYHSKIAVDRLVELFESEPPYDCVIVDHLHLAQLALDVKSAVLKNKTTVPPLVLRTPNVESTIVKKYAERVDNPMIKAFAGNEAIKMKTYESNVFSEFDLVAAISDMDRKAFEKMSEKPANFITVTAGVDVDELRPSKINPVEGEVVFVGSFDWQPNVDGATWLINEVWPKVIEKFPAAHFTLVGKKPPPYLEKLASDTVEATGYVDSVTEYINRATCCVVPLWIGSGMRLKILEAFALGKAVVSTSLGAEGIEYLEGEDILIRDDAGSFADGILDVLGNAELRQELGRNARVVAERKYSWKIVASGFRDEIQKLI
jgi:glycosyltransferase involved in cell wall biosynthesis